MFQAGQPPDILSDRACQLIVTQIEDLEVDEAGYARADRSRELVSR